MTISLSKRRYLAAAVALGSLLAACSSSSSSSGGGNGATTTTTTKAPSGSTAPGSTTPGTAGPGGTGTGETCATSGDPIKLAVNPWTGSAVNAYVAKSVIECNIGTPVEIVNVDENATWTGLDDGSLDAVLEVWPSGHAADYKTYVTDKKSVVDLGVLGPNAKIGWYVPKFVVDEHPELATWEGFKKPELAKLFATAETGDLGQFLMGDPSYVTYDEQIIANLKLPLKYVVAGSEASLLTAIDQSIADKKPLLLQFWQPHWKQSKVQLVEVKLPDVTDACTKSAAANDGGYACDYPVDHLYKAASAKLEGKNAKVFALLQKLQLTTDQQNSIAASIDGDGLKPEAAAQKWVDANKAVWSAWLG
jgi:glycine betaine/proline transport system substrate-binding protein